MWSRKNFKEKNSSFQKTKNKQTVNNKFWFFFVLRKWNNVNYCLKTCVKLKLKSQKMPKIFALRHQLAEQQAKLKQQAKGSLYGTASPNASSDEEKIGSSSKTLQPSPSISASKESLAVAVNAEAAPVISRLPHQEDLPASQSKSEQSAPLELVHHRQSSSGTAHNSYFLKAIWQKVHRKYHAAAVYFFGKRQLVIAINGVNQGLAMEKIDFLDEKSGDLNACPLNSYAIFLRLFVSWPIPSHPPQLSRYV